MKYENSGSERKRYFLHNFTNNQSLALIKSSATKLMVALSAIVVMTRKTLRCKDQARQHAFKK